MNNPHQNARMTPLGRAEMVRRIVEERRPVADVAAGLGEGSALAILFSQYLTVTDCYRVVLPVR